MGPGTLEEVVFSLALLGAIFLLTTRQDDDEKKRGTLE